jgi:hypothetical protein
VSDDPTELRNRYLAIVAQETSGASAAELVIRWLEFAADAQRVLGTHAEMVLLAHYGVARARRLLGDVAGAITELDAVLANQRASFGDLHPATLETRTWRALWRGNDGDAASARAEFEVLIPALAKAFGSDAESALYARVAYGAWMSEDVSLIERLSEATVVRDDVVRALGAEHPLAQSAEDTLRLLDVQWRDHLEDHRGVAVDLLTDMEFEEGHGERPEDGRGWADTSGLDDEARDRVVTGSEEEVEGEREFLQAVIVDKRALAVARRTHGYDSEDALAAQCDVAQTYLEGGSPEACRIATTLVDDCIRVLGQRHPLTARVRDLRERAAII